MTVRKGTTARSERARAKRPKVVHYYHVGDLARASAGDGADEVRFLCGEWGRLNYRGAGQHRPLPQVGRMITIEGNGDCPTCVAVYDGRAECDRWDCDHVHKGEHRNALRLRGYASMLVVVPQNWKALTP